MSAVTRGEAVSGGGRATAEQVARLAALVRAYWADATERPRVRSEMDYLRDEWGEAVYEDAAAQYDGERCMRAERAGAFR